MDIDKVSYSICCVMHSVQAQLYLDKEMRNTEVSYSF